MENKTEEKHMKENNEHKKETHEKSVETKPKEEKAKKIEIKRPKKEEAVANGHSLHMSKKQAMYICKFIKGKKVDKAIADLNQVIKLKMAVPFKGEIPHRKGNIMSGRYPVKAAGLFISLLKGLRGNIIVNGLDLDKTKIYYASANWANRPMKSGRRLAKRTNVVLKAKEITK